VAHYVWVEFVGGPLCGEKRKLNIGKHTTPPDALDKLYILSDQELESKHTAYGYSYHLGRCIAVHHEQT
jgi:hypothetical protein